MSCYCSFWREHGASRQEEQSGVVRVTINSYPPTLMN